jgi:hypothetical protein
MIIDPNDPNEVMELYSLIETAREKGKKLKVTYEQKRHSDPQRKYFHFLLSYFANQYGCTLTEAKERHLKLLCLPDFFDTGKVDRGGHKVMRSTSELNTSEYSYVIENFRSYCDINGIPTPDPDDTTSIRYCEREIEKTEIYGT